MSRLLRITKNEIKDLISKNFLKDGIRYKLLDVRNPGETRGGIIDAATCVPLPQLESAIHLSKEDFAKLYNNSKFEKDEKIITYCKAGGRARDGAAMLEKNGYDVIVYEGSWNDWTQE